MKSILVSSIAVLLMLAGCSKNDSSPSSAPLNPETPGSPTTEGKALEGSFSVKENHNRDLGHYVSGQNNAAVVCKLVSVPNSATGKLINLEAKWKWENPEKTDQEFYRIRIEAQSPRDILPGKNNFDFIDALVHLYRSKIRQAPRSEFLALQPDAYGCDVSNLEKLDQKLSGRILCYKNNVYHGYNLRINFTCTLN